MVVGRNNGHINGVVVRRGSTVTGYGELCVCFYPIRIGEIF